MNSGILVPFLIDEALPGDTFSVNLTGLARLATPLHPYMDNAYMDTHFFAVPYRLLWDNWQRMNGEQIDPGDSTDYVVPKMTSPVGGYLPNSLEDYLGLPVGIAGIEHMALAHRAYNLIWNEWFRDQNLQDSIPVFIDDGPDPQLYELAPRGKRHDYFTSCLPWPQKGEAVNIPLGNAAPVHATSTAQSPSTPTIGVFSDGANANRQFIPVGSTSVNIAETAGQPVPESLLYTDLSQATAATINQLRQAFQIQKLLERDARGGTRYTEIIRSHFGVTSPDARLQRPEYLGGGSSSIQIQPVASTVPTDLGTTTPQANLAGVGTAALQRHGFTKSFTEHTIIIGLVNVRADLTYQQGLERMWSRQTRYDFYWPALAHIGEQAVLSKEIYADGTARDEDVFGYQERYAEYRYKPSKITGKMRSNDAQSLDVWHLSQDFATRPNLNEAFIIDNPPIDRVVAVPSEPDFILDCYFDMKCARPMPLYGVPGLIDHF